MKFANLLLLQLLKAPKPFHIFIVMETLTAPFTLTCYLTSHFEVMCISAFPMIKNVCLEVLALNSVPSYICDSLNNIAGGIHRTLFSCHKKVVLLYGSTLKISLL